VVRAGIFPTIEGDRLKFFWPFDYAVLLTLLNSRILFLPPYGLAPTSGRGKRGDQGPNLAINRACASCLPRAA